MEEKRRDEAPGQAWFFFWSACAPPRLPNLERRGTTRQPSRVYVMSRSQDSLRTRPRRSLGSATLQYTQSGASIYTIRICIVTYIQRDVMPYGDGGR